MFTTIDIHISDDTVIEVNDSGNGLVIREATSYEPRLNLFFGTEPSEVAVHAEELTRVLRILKE